MAMERLIIDMDDVIADATGRLIARYEEEFGHRVDRSTLDHKEEGHGYPVSREQIRKYVYEAGFFRGMVPNENSQEVIESLNQRYSLFIVSAAMEFPLSLFEKQEWLNHFFPFLTWKQFVFCGSKAVVHGDYMIDDLPHNLESFNGEKFIYTAPHNLQFNQFHRLNNWQEVAKRFL
jgi:5'(3')-deoxyribonucleotidase